MRIVIFANLSDDYPSDKEIDVWTPIVPGEDVITEDKKVEELKKQLEGKINKEDSLNVINVGEVR